LRLALKRNRRRLVLLYVEDPEISADIERSGNRERNLEGLLLGRLLFVGFLCGVRDERDGACASVGAKVTGTSVFSPERRTVRREPSGTMIGFASALASLAVRKTGGLRV
jgi:hypothetical protein